MYPKIINKIIKLGYDVRKCSDFHWQVFHDNTFTNVWHTNRKFMRQGDSGSSFYWKDNMLLKTLGKPTPRKTSQIIMTAEQIKEKIEAKNQHEIGLNKILSKLNKKKK